MKPLINNRTQKGETVSRPIQIKITNDVTVNFNNVVSYAVEKGLAYRRPKEDAVPDENGKYKEEDYDIKAADTISIFFIGGHGLTFRVGEDITREDYDRVAKSLKVLEFKLKENSEGNSASNKPVKDA